MLYLVEKTVTFNMALKVKDGGLSAKGIIILALEFLKCGFFHKCQGHTCLGMCVYQKSYDFV